VAGFSFPMPTHRGQRGSYRSRSTGRSLFGMGSRGGSGWKVRLLIAAVIAVFALVSYYGKPGDENQITGEVERVAYPDEEDEIALGLQAMPEIARQFGGRLGGADADAVAVMGTRLVRALEESLAQEGRSNPYEFQFHLLADPKTVNAFALPGGQVFITRALYSRLGTPGQLAAVLGHEMGHVLSRHGNKRMAQEQLFTGLATAAGVGGGGDINSMRMAHMVKQVVSMSYGREDEYESDKWGVELCLLAGYDPNAMIGLMEVLDEASGGGAGPPEFMSTHPKPANRIEYIKGVIAEVEREKYPEGLPPDLQP
jgi:beta-barrel assembly-enhancing protease